MNIPKCCSELTKNTNSNEFETAILLNKRVVELMHGSKALVDTKNKNYIETSVSELLSGKIKSGTSK